MWDSIQAGSSWPPNSNSSPALGLQEETNDAFLPECVKTGQLGSLAGMWTSGSTHHVTVGPSESSVAENLVFLISHFAAWH